MHEEEVAVVFFGLAATTICIWLVIGYLFAAFRHWRTTGIVRDMVARGYSAQEIINVCQVVGPRRVSRRWGSLMAVPPAKPIRQPAYG